MKRILNFACWLMLIFCAVIALDSGSGFAGDKSSSSEQVKSTASGYDADALLATFGLAAKVDENLAPDSDEARQNPDWPVLMFLTGEQHLQHGRQDQALSCYRKIIRWGASDPYGDGYGGNGVVAAAAWRFLAIAPTVDTLDNDDVASLIGDIQKLSQTRLMQGMMRPSILGSIPLMEKDILRNGSRLAWKVNAKGQAVEWMLEWLPDSCMEDLTEDEVAVIEQARTSGRLSNPQLELTLGRCFKRQGQEDLAVILLQKAAAGDEQEIGSEALLDLAAVRTRSLDSKDDYRAVAEMLTTVYQQSKDPGLAQKALYRRAFLYLRRGPWFDQEKFRKDLLLLAEKYPDGQLADDALYRLAVHDQDSGKLEEALAAYRRLQQFKGANDWANLTYFKPAMLLISRGEKGDADSARNLLEQLEAKFPKGPLHLAARFWIGRLAEESGDNVRARESFKQVVSESPYHYYAIRSAMHLKLGRRACREKLPDRELGQSWLEQLRTHPAPDDLPAASPYHQRVRKAVDSGLCGDLLQVVHELRSAFPDTRPEQIPPDQLDQSGNLTALIMLTAYRQDVLAARDVMATADNRLHLAAFVGRKGNDWPLAMRLVTATHEPQQVRYAAQRDPRYLAVAYPVVYKGLLKEAAKSHNVPPELLYAVMRNESLFKPDALSNRQALGLFQFVPSTFAVLDKRWSLLQRSAHACREAYLRDPRSSIQLGARWFEQELLKRNDGEILFAVMEHNAGYPAVKRWKAGWQREGRIDDVEYVLETVPYFETRLFTKRVWRDLVIVQAIGILK